MSMIASKAFRCKIDPYGLDTYGLIGGLWADVGAADAHIHRYLPMSVQNIAIHGTKARPTT